MAYSLEQQVDSQQTCRQQQHAMHSYLKLPSGVFTKIYLSPNTLICKGLWRDLAKVISIPLENNRDRHVWQGFELMTSCLCTHCISVVLRLCAQRELKVRVL